MNRLLGRRVGTCFQRFTGHDCMVSLSLTKYAVDRKYGTQFNKRFIDFLKYMQKNDLVADAGLTDVKGDRNLADGSKREKYIPQASGTTENPVSDEGLAEKFKDLAVPVIGDRSGFVLDLVRSPERIDDAVQLAGLLVG